MHEKHQRKAGVFRLHIPCDPKQATCVACGEESKGAAMFESVETVSEHCFKGREYLGFEELATNNP